MQTSFVTFVRIFALFCRRCIFETFTEPSRTTHTQNRSRKMWFLPFSEQKLVQYAVDQLYKLIPM